MQECQCSVIEAFALSLLLLHAASLTGNLLLGDHCQHTHPLLLLWLSAFIACLQEGNLLVQEAATTWGISVQHTQQFLVILAVPFEVYVRLTDGVITLVLFAHREKTYLCRRRPRYGAPLCSTQASSWIISWASAGCQALLCCAGCSALLHWACNLLMMPWNASSASTSSTTLLPGFLRAHRSASLLFCFMPNLEEKEVMTTISTRIHQRLWACLVDLSERFCNSTNYMHVSHVHVFPCQASSRLSTMPAG